MLASSPVLSHQGIRSYLVHRDSCMALPSEARLPRFSHGARRMAFHFLLFSSLYVEPPWSSDFLHVDEQGYLWCPRLYDCFSWEWDSLQVSRSEHLKRKLTCWNLLLPSWLVGLTTTSSFFSWLVINLTFTRFREDNLMNLIDYWLFSGSGMLFQGIDPKSNSYHNRFQPWIAYWAMFWLSIFILISGYSVFFRWNTSKFVTSCRPFSSFPLLIKLIYLCLDLNLPIFFSLYLGYKYFNKTKFWKASEMDFYTVSDFSLSRFTSLTTLAS